MFDHATFVTIALKCKSFNIYYVLHTISVVALCSIPVGETKIAKINCASYVMIEWAYVGVV